jgi:hypothetical protein
MELDATGAGRLRVGSRDIPLMAMPDGSYVMAGGLGLGIPVTFSRDDTGVPFLAIAELETVRWLTGG